LSPLTSLKRRPGRSALAAIALIAAALALVSSGVGTTSQATAQGSGAEPTPQTDASVPAEEVVMFGASPEEGPDETWGIGSHEGMTTVVRYTGETPGEEGHWSLGPPLLNAEGQPLTSFELVSSGPPEDVPSPLDGEMTPDGAGVLIGDVTTETKGSAESKPAVLVRNPGNSENAFQETAAVPTEGSQALLESGEQLINQQQPPMIAALEESGGKAGALVVPIKKGVQQWVLHWNGTDWTREEIEVPKSSKEGFEVLAIAASSPENAWLIARLSAPEYPAGSIALFKRQAQGSGEAPTWQPVALKTGGEPGEPISVEVNGGSQVPFIVPVEDKSQLLTVTSEGIWIDGERSDAHVSATIFLRPEGSGEAHAVAAWCAIPTGAEPCRYDLPEALPTGSSRSFAWASASTVERLGERVLTGFSGGVSWRLQGTEFKRILALGGTGRRGRDARHNVGGTFGAAFSSAVEGWLGQETLPVHLTLDPSPTRLTSWPVSFRFPLLALVPQPDAPVGSLSSQALAVGEEGAVARYEPGKGWLPESLLGPGGRKKPTLRAVAWPTPARAYAVGDYGEMWLWRGETGLWEPDPATPRNFRGNLLGVAFEPNEPAVGYAVGEAGVLLRFGKTWTQVPTCAAGVSQPCLPPEVAGAEFTSIAFAGSEVLVVYQIHVPRGGGYEETGGLLVNNGSEWHVEAATTESDVPGVVAGLPDGGAAFTATQPVAHSGQRAKPGARVYERESADAPWRQVSVPPSNLGPGSLSLFRENGALRAVVSGKHQGRSTEELEEPVPPAGSPPRLVNPPETESRFNTGILRQTATGWSDEEHELNNDQEPEGEYFEWDGPYMPDPVTAVLVGPNGGAGWAVGGLAYSKEANILDTSDVWRYREAAAPTGVTSAPVVTNKESLSATTPPATFAIGGGSQCAGPCADLARAGIGPDVWLSTAVSEAHRIPGLRGFFYTGPRLTTGRTVGARIQSLPYEQELERYAAILAAGENVYAAASPTDLADGSESLFEKVFQSFPEPFGQSPKGESGQTCSPGSAKCRLAYALQTGPGTANPVRVIVLDDTTDVESEQLVWLEAELAAAIKGSEPAIVIGNADLEAQIAANDRKAQEVAEALVRGQASAYFFDSPEENEEVILHAAGGEIKTFGSGTLGYIRPNDIDGVENSEFLGENGFLYASVATNAIPHQGNVHEVTTKLIPDIGELAIEAEDGTLLKRSHTGLFRALARRPRAGNRWGASEDPEAEGTQGMGNPYIPIPYNCRGIACAKEIKTEYSFSSSSPEIGEFVEPNLTAEPQGKVPLLGAGKYEPEEPIPDHESGLFCAYNKGETIVTITAGGLSYSLPVTVEAGSAERPCGTTPLNEGSSKQQVAPVPPPPSPAPTPAGTAPASTPPVLPVPPPPVAAGVPAAPRPPPPPTPAPPTPFFIQPALPFVALAFVPPPLPAPAEPTPPSGTSAVTSPVEAAQKEEEEEKATESVSNQAVAYRAPEQEPSPAYLLGIVILAAFAGTSLRGRPGRRGREVRIVPATLTATRAQRRISRTRDRRF
jgi:hypothetical protein